MKTPRRGPAARVSQGLLLFVTATLAGCTTASVRRPADLTSIPEVRIGDVRVDLDRSAIEPDRVTRLEEIGTAAALEKKIGQYLGEASLREGDMVLAVRIDAFRLPAGGRWITGDLKGNDVLGAAVTLTQAEAEVHQAAIRVQLGAGDRSVGANFSADWAHETLIDMLAWETAWELTALTGGRGDDALLAAGKRDGVRHAILVLAHRGRLSYTEMVKYAAMGKIGVENSDLSAKYDACALRRTVSLGMSSCAWEPGYR